MPPSNPAPAALSTDDDHYEDLLGLWSDLEAGLHLVLTSPVLVPQFPAKIQQLETWMRDLVAHDTDAALYLMFQLASPPPAPLLPCTRWSAPRCARFWPPNFSCRCTNATAWCAQR